MDEECRFRTFSELNAPKTAIGLVQKFEEQVSQRLKKYVISRLDIFRLGS